MTNQPQEQIEDILTAIRKACPELMELSFGCEVEGKPAFGSAFRNNRPLGGRWIATAKDTTGAWMFPSEIGFVRVKEQELARWHTIIGHEPHLEHLLRALNLPGDTRYETIVLQGSTLRIITPTRETETSIEEGVGINNEQYDTVTNDVWADITIDLTKSLRQNLENKDLREFIHSLLKV